MRLISAFKGRLRAWLHGHRSSRFFVLVVVAISLSWSPNPTLAVSTLLRQDSHELALQRDEDSKLVDGLRRRRLFDLAQLHCQTRLAQTEIDPTSEAHLTIELMKTRTAQAILTNATERPAVWKSVDTTASQFSTNAPDHPRRLLVEVQAALSHMTHARTIRQEIAAEITTQAAGQIALEEIRTARSLLNQLGVDIDKAIPELRGRSTTEHDLTVQQLLNLKNNLQFQLANCNLIRSQLYQPEDRLNRVAALGEVKQQLGEVQRVTSQGQPLWWNTQLGLLECLRLLGDSGAAKQLVDSLPTKTIPPATVLPLLEQKIRLAIEMGNEAFSKQVFQEYLKLPASSPQLDLALVELASDLSARATSDELKNQWLDYASGFARKIESDHGDYWGRRADLVLIRAIGGNPAVVATPDNPGGNDGVMEKPSGVSNTELEQMIRLGENAFRKNNLDDAIKAYQQAVAKSVSLGDSDRTLQLGMAIGQIFEKQSNPKSAADQFIKSALADVGASNAAAVHLRGCWNLASTLKGKTTQNAAEDITNYREELQRHLKLWPGQPTADHARLYLADQNQRDRQWKSAFENYVGVRTDSPHFPIAIKGLGTTSRQLLSQTKRDNQSTLNTSLNLISALSKKRSQIAPGSSPASQIEILISELEFLYGGGANDPSIASTISKRLEPLQTSTEPAIVGSSQAIRAAAICDTEIEKAKQLVGQLTDEGSLKLCERCLEAIVISRGANESRTASGLRLDVIDKLLSKTSDAEGSRGSTNLLLKKSSVLSSLDRHAESVSLLEKLKTEFPKNAGIQMRLARSLTAQHGTSNPDKPLDHWRRLLRKLKSHTSNWYEAKYNIAKLLHETGQSAETVKLLRLLRDVGPGWNDSSLKPEFESLLKSAQAAK